MNIEDRAHDYALKLLEYGNMTPEEVVSTSWFIAEAMQAEAEKRKATPNADPMRKVREAEWQPDWSQAPRGINYWFKNGKQSFWSVNEPELVNGIGFYAIGFNMEAPSFNYQGDWKDSLRKRP